MFGGRVFWGFFPDEKGEDGQGEEEGNNREEEDIMVFEGVVLEKVESGKKKERADDGAEGVQSPDNAKTLTPGFFLGGVGNQGVFRRILDSFADTIKETKEENKSSRGSQSQERAADEGEKVAGKNNGFTLSQAVGEETGNYFKDTGACCNQALGGANESFVQMENIGQVERKDGDDDVLTDAAEETQKADVKGIFLGGHGYLIIAFL